MATTLEGFLAGNFLLLDLDVVALCCTLRKARHGSWFPLLLIVFIVFLFSTASSYFILASWEHSRWIRVGFSDSILGMTSLFGSIAHTVCAA